MLNLKVIILYLIYLLILQIDIKYFRILENSQSLKVFIYQ